MLKEGIEATVLKRVFQDFPSICWREKSLPALLKHCTQPYYNKLFLLYIQVLSSFYNFITRAATQLHPLINTR